MAEDTQTVNELPPFFETAANLIRLRNFWENPSFDPRLTMVPGGSGDAGGGYDPAAAAAAAAQQAQQAAAQAQQQAAELARQASLQAEASSSWKIDVSTGSMLVLGVFVGALVFGGFRGD